MTLEHVAWVCRWAQMHEEWEMQEVYQGLLMARWWGRMGGARKSRAR